MKPTRRLSKVLAGAVWENLPSYTVGFLWCYMVDHHWSLPAELVGVGGYAVGLLIYEFIDAFVRS